MTNSKRKGWLLAFSQPLAAAQVQLLRPQWEWDPDVRNRSHGTLQDLQGGQVDKRHQVEGQRKEFGVFKVYFY